MLSQLVADSNFCSATPEYQLLYVYVSRVESGGRQWNVVVNRLLVCLIFMQLLVVLSEFSPVGNSSFAAVLTTIALFSQRLRS